MVAGVCNPGWEKREELRQEDQEFEDSLDSNVRPCLRKRGRGSLSRICSQKERMEEKVGLSRAQILLKVHTGNNGEV